MPPMFLEARNIKNYINQNNNNVSIAKLKEMYRI